MTAKELFASVADVASAGAQKALDGLGAAYDVAEKPGMQGAAELAGALFNGSAYTPYGAGQQPAQIEQGKDMGQEAPQHGLPEMEMGRE